MMDSTGETRIDAKLEELEAYCRRHGLPLTVQGRAVLHALAARDDHPTADHVFEEVQRQHPTLARTTVYRILDRLVAAGIAIRICHPGSAARYDARTDRHHHFVCMQCQSVFDVPATDETPNAVWGSLDPTFRVVDFSIYFRGLCPECGRGVALPPAAGNALDAPKDGDTPQ